MPPRSYFYKDENGTLKKFVYCSMCGTGPFKESQKNFEYLSLHGRVSNNYCLPCAKNAGLSIAELTDKSNQVAKEKVEEIVFKKEELTEVVIRDTSQDVIEPTPPKLSPPESDTSKPAPLEPYTPEPVPLEPVNVVVEEQGPFYVYIGQFTDNTFVTGVSTDYKRDILRMNSGTNEKLKKLPVELVYFHEEKSKRDAQDAKTAIMLMGSTQKEDLIKKFTENYFKN